jgi:dTDP-4-dehydrorhamnose 3,5-epimerase
MPQRTLPGGVELVPISPHTDERGSFAEVFRDSWPTGVSPAQWNVCRSRAGVLRGVHCHLRHADYLMLLDGRLVLGLHDLRPGSSTEGWSGLLDLPAGELGVVIPPGVAHGFYFPDPSLHLYAVTHEFDPTDELGCTWNDPELGLDWPCAAPLLSPRDQQAPPLDFLRDAVRLAC